MVWLVQGSMAVAGLGWMVAFGCGLKLLFLHRAEDRSVGYYLPRGIVWFSPDSWAPSGANTQRAMLGGLAVFGLGVAGAGLGIVLSSGA